VALVVALVVTFVVALVVGFVVDIVVGSSVAGSVGTAVGGTVDGLMVWSSDGTTVGAATDAVVGAVDAFVFGIVVDCGSVGSVAMVGSVFGEDTDTPIFAQATKGNMLHSSRQIASHFFTMYMPPFTELKNDLSL